jgi:hypothetical protein
VIAGFSVIRCGQLDALYANAADPRRQAQCRRIQILAERLFKRLGELDYRSA